MLYACQLPVVCAGVHRPTGAALAWGLLPYMFMCCELKALELLMSQGTASTMTTSGCCMAGTTCETSVS